MKRPDFFIVGAPKSGTTALNHYLSLHPDIFVPKRNELHYFGSDLAMTGPRLTLAEYESYFEPASPAQKVGEASVWYLFSERAAAEIHEYNPNAKIIIILRNPADMLHSQHSQFLYNGNEDIASFEDALDAEPDRKRGRRAPRTVMLISGLYYLETARYYDQVLRYIATFGRNNVLILLYDDLEVDSDAVFRKVITFLDLPYFAIGNYERVNRNRNIRFLFLHRGRLIARKYAPLIVRFLPSRLYRSLLDYYDKVNISHEERKPLSAATRRRIVEALRPDIENLSRLIERNLDPWLKV